MQLTPWSVILLHEYKLSFVSEVSDINPLTPKSLILWQQSKLRFVNSVKLLRWLTASSVILMHRYKLSLVRVVIDATTRNPTSITFKQQPKSTSFKTVKLPRWLTPSSVIFSHLYKQSLVRSTNDVKYIMPMFVKLWVLPRSRSLRFEEFLRNPIPVSVISLVHDISPHVKSNLVKFGSLNRLRNPASVITFIPCRCKLLILMNFGAITSTSSPNWTWRLGALNMVVDWVAQRDQCLLTKRKCFIICNTMSSLLSECSRRASIVSRSSKGGLSQAMLGHWSWHKKTTEIDCRKKVTSNGVLQGDYSEFVAIYISIVDLVWDRGCEATQHQWSYIAWPKYSFNRSELRGQ